MGDRVVRTRRREAVGVGVSLAAVGLILALHYGAEPQAFSLHDLLRRLFYLPVITAAIAGGLRGGLLAAGLAAIGYLPHLPQLGGAGERVLDHALELVLLPVVGALVGGFADASRRARAVAAERGRLAAIGEVGLAVMAQADGPLAAIEGQAETLAFQALRARDEPLGLSARVIHDEAALVRRFLADLRGLGRPRARGPRPVNLSGLLFGVSREIRAAGGAERLRLVSLSEDAWVEADRAVLAFSLRSLLVGLLESVPAPGHLEVSLMDEGGSRLAIEIVVSSPNGPVPDLENTLARVFDGRVSEYRFRRALCVHLLAAEGAAVEFSRRSAESAAVRLRLPRVAGPTPRGPRPRSAFGKPRPRRAAGEAP